MKGIVQKIYADKKTSKKTGKPFTVYTLLVDGTRYQCGFDKPKCSEGDTIEFEASEGEYGFEVDVGSIEVVAKAASKPKGTSGTRSSSETPDTRTERIEHQSARRDAIELVRLQLEAGVLKVKTVEDVNKAVDNEAQRLYSTLTGGVSPAEKEQIEGMKGAARKKAPEPEPEDEEDPF